MRGLKPLSMAATLIAAVSASAVSANMPPDLHDDEPEAPDEKKGGNAIDNTTSQPAAAGRPGTGPGSLPPEAYERIGDALAQAFDPFAVFWEVENEWTSPKADSSSTFSWLVPTDGPAESILDQLDERRTPLPMVGEPGSEVTVAGETPTPPPESILDFIDTAPTPQPAVSPTQEASKPAVDQAPKPAVVETPPP
jgi:hypothetical protein